MQQSNHSHTKIIATIGPACNNKDTLRQMILEGIDVCRLNFSHGSHDDHKKVINIVRELNEELDTNVALLADLQGPKLRVGDMENGGVFLNDGKALRLVTYKCLGTSDRVYLNYSPLPQEVKQGEIILIDDGKIKLQVEETNEKDEIITRIISGGNLSGRKGVNLPNTHISLPSLTPKDIQDANFALENDIDWIALSFVRKAVDVLELKELIKKSKTHANVIAKIEKPEAL
ncbi:MAG: pyruvate kinase, partial [Bacteroidota bacterium]